MSRLASKAGSIPKKKKQQQRNNNNNKKTKTGYGTDDTNGVQAQKFRYNKTTRICWLGVHSHLRQFWPLNLESIENSDQCHKKDQFAYFRPMLKNAVTEPVTHLSVPPVPWGSIKENATVGDAKLAFGIWAR